MKIAMELVRDLFARGMCVAAIGAVLLLSACGGDELISSRIVDAAAIRLPMIVAHRGGAADAPENTLDAIRLAVTNKADAIWVTVQLSKDDVPVLYRPANLITQTGVEGVVADHTADELARMNAGWSFKDADGRYPYRSNPVGIPSLRDALRTIPNGMPIVLDMKALPAEPQARAVARVLSEEAAWSRVTIYSTESDYQRAFAVYPEAKLFESRDATRDRLVKVLLGEGCENAPTVPEWTAFELHRKLTVTERFTLGEGHSDANSTMWTPATVACFRELAPVRIMAISVNDTKDYRAAACLGIDAVLTDSPKTLAAIRAQARATVCSR
ncbi:glycerophosphodiester phosphodiesterase family protein [Burkholderia cepacia]|uniref:glycerophosphodiester phosphodiesterase family protein n=1 Tax=Burkholderia cepacia TaxID=292 RepID=UPI002AB68921|nr:glycerophosphodiester phosphodiesterase family protein [Burkholderia cepacia]